MAGRHYDHETHLLAAHGRHLVRPHLRPGTAATVAHPRRGLAAFAVPPPIAELHNGSPGDVILQGFHYTSFKSSPTSWYAVLAANAAAIRSARFDAAWLPPPSACADGEGYLPTRWLVFDSCYGSAAELGFAIAALGPVKAIADVVVNHRCGVATGGADFADPAFPVPSAAVCSDDECGCGTGALDTGEAQAAGRDLDHTNPDVQAAVVDYLGQLQGLGFAGWRYDEARGYGGSYVGLYNDRTAPYLSVGEYWDGDRQNVMNWIDATHGRSMAFDFPTRAYLKAALAERQFWSLNAGGRPPGAIGWWPAMSVTFIENHDTDKDSQHPDEFGTGDQVLQGYAYLLTHPGVPCVFWVHFFDYGADVQNQIKALIAIRKSSGITRTSVVDIIAADDAKYAAIIDGRVAVKIGPGPWAPGPGWGVATDGNDYAVWTRS
jgi:alpha-amylase